MEMIRVALIGLDTSHSIEFTRRMQSPDCEPDLKVDGIQAVSCLRFMTPFTCADILNSRQKQLEQWGVRVTENFEEAVADCDAIMIEINDPSLHWDYFQKCADLHKPIFIDKPLADTYENGKKIVDLSRKQKIPVMSSSSLRFAHAFVEACQAVPNPSQVIAFGPLGIPAAGEGLIWYGVHSFEMLQRAMGIGAQCVDARSDESGVVTIVTYPHSRRGTVVLTENHYAYGGTLIDPESAFPYIVDSSRIYTEQLKVIVDFFRTGEAPLTLDDTLEVMRLLDAAVASCNSRTPVVLS